MSIKYYNTETGKYEVVSSNLASTTRVLDVDGRFESEDVEGCLKELSTELDEMGEVVKYIYENGTLGGGGGGGGGTLPTVKLEMDEEIITSTDAKVDVYFSFTSPNGGDGTAVITVDNNSREVKIKQGRNKFTCGPFTKGKHRVDIYAIDRADMYSNSITLHITAGALELSSAFDAKDDFSIADNITIDYDISSISPEAVSVDLTLDGVTKTVEGIIGKNTWNIGTIDRIGVHKASIQARNSSLSSNILAYNLVISDTNSIFMSTEFDQTTIVVGKKIVVDYRISMKGEQYFTTDMYLNGNHINTANSKYGVNYYNLGDNLEPGNYVLTMVSRTKDGLLTSNELRIEFDVVTSDFVPFKPVTRRLIAAFDASGKNNDSLTKNKWEDKSGNNVDCTLYNFNYKTNGWLDEGLRFIGKTYAEIDLAPFANNIPQGFTLDILYKTENVGDIYGRVIDFKNVVTPYQGFKIDTMEAEMRSSNARIVTSPFKEGEWVRITVTIDREEGIMKMYTNGIISRVILLGRNEPFELSNKIVLGASKDEQGRIVHNGFCDIKELRLHDVPLTDDEVLQNYISGIKDQDEQMAIRELNFGDNTLPVLNLTGDLNGMTDKVERVLAVTYIDPADPTKNIRSGDGVSAAVSWQGTSSRTYPVKNYTIKLRKGGNDLLDYSPKDHWLPESRYTLKANYMETSHANNIGLAKYAHDFFKLHPYPQQIKNPKTRHCVDGFPIQLQINGEDMGIYTYNIDRYAHNILGLTGETTAVSYEIGVNSTGGAGAFADDSWESIREEFKCRYNYRGSEEVVTEDLGNDVSVLKAGYHSELQDLVTWVKNTPDLDFMTQFEEHFSKRHMIDYFLIVYTFGLVDSLGKNMVLTTFGRDENGFVRWYPSFYDMDTCLSLSNDGEIRYEPSVDFEYGEYNTSDSMLWQKMQRVFGIEIADRYKELRLKEFTPEYILQFIQGEVIDKIPHNQYNKDVRLKYLIPESLEWIKVCNGTRLEHTKRWLEERFIYMDSVYEYGDFAEKFAVVRSNIKGDITLRLKTYSPQKIKIKFSDAASNQVKQLVNKDKWYEFTGTINNGTDNNIYIYGAPGLMYLDGLKDLQISNLAIGNATKIVEIDCRGSRHLNQLQLGANKLLQKVDVSGCINLGSIAEFKRLDLSNCINLKYLDCSNTKLGEVVFNEEGGSLETLNLSNTDLTSLSLVGQEYLPSINVSNCKELSSFSIEACNALTTVSLPYSKLSSFNVVECENIEELDISYTGYLKKLDLSGCPNLTKLVMAGVSNPAITELDLTYCKKIKHLNISKCDFLGLVKFGEGCNTLKYFNASHSGIRQFKYGRQEAAEYLDLGGFSLDEVYFENAAYVEEIRNINLIAKGSMKPFYNCKNLRAIHGTVRLRDSITEGFYGCTNLEVLPEVFDLSEVTSLSDTFNGCKAFTMEHVKKIMGSVRKVTNLYRTFNGCSSVVVNEDNPIPSDLFRNCGNVTDFTFTFIGCTMTNHQIPVGLLDPMVSLRTYRQPFNGAVGFLPPTYFSKCTKLVTVWDGFTGNKFSVAPNANLFANCPKLEKVTSLFSGVSTMVGQIPENLFANNPNLRYADGIFNGCSGLVGSIPENLFANNPNLITARSAFNGCKNLTGQIPENLFANNAILNDLGYAFSGCVSLTGQIPENILTNNHTIASLDYTFNGCVGLGGEPGNLQEVPVNLLKNKRQLVTTEGLFKNCALLQFNIPEGFLSDCVSLRKVSEMFMGCDGLTGSIPNGLFTCYDTEGEVVDTLIDTAARMFSGCKYLTGRIPEDIFEKFLLVTNLDGFFQNCHRIEGEIHPTLLHNCFSLISAASLFVECWQLGKQRVTEEDPYFIDPDFFMYCPLLENLSSAFSMWNGTSKLIGELPEDLFMYCTKLKRLDGMFANCKFTGTISDSLFRNNTLLENISSMFQGSAITAIEGQCITSKHNKITNFTRTFYVPALVGEAPELWVTHSAAERAECFKGAVNLSNYDDIPLTWK